MTSIFDQHLDKKSANFVALSPVSFVERTAEVFGDLTAVIHGMRRYKWAQTRDRSARLAAALNAHGVKRGSTVSVMRPNTPEMVDALYRRPAVVSCAVVAKPDSKWGEMPVAYVETKDGVQVSEQDLIDHCKVLLADYKVPRDIRFESIPKTSTGKIQKFELRKLAEKAFAS